VHRRKYASQAVASSVDAPEKTWGEITSDIDDDNIPGLLEAPDAVCDVEVDDKETKPSGLTDTDRVLGPRNGILWGNVTCDIQKSKKYYSCKPQF